MLGDDRSDRIRERLWLEIARNPCALGSSEQRLNRRVVVTYWAEIEIRRICDMLSVAIRIKLHVHHPFRDLPSLAGRQDARILNRVFEIEEHAWPRARVALVNENSPS